jgi:hypothetical protein
MIDYNDMIAAVTTTVKAATGFPVVVQGSNQQTPPYPYCAFTITSPYLSSVEMVTAEGIEEDVEVVFSLTWHCEDQVEALELTQKTATNFKKSSTIQKLGDRGLSVVRINGFGNRDTFITIDVERRYGFDLRLRTRHADSDGSTEFFETVV